MSGETNLKTLLSSLRPVMDPETYTFATVPEAEVGPIRSDLGRFREAEGISVICLLGEAKTLGLQHSGEFRRISLTVHSSLEAVGLTASVSTALADKGIPCNVVAGYHHDHLFIPAPLVETALQTLLALSARHAP